MERKRYLVMATGFGLVLASAILVLTYGTMNAQECRIINLYGGDAVQVKTVRIEPQTIVISKGACVVWVNWVRAQDITIKFSDGKTCKDVTESPTKFQLDEQGCYVTSWIPLGGTSSLRFNKEGTYEYVAYTRLGYEAGGIQAKGSIVVQ